MSNRRLLIALLTTLCLSACADETTPDGEEGTLGGDDSGAETDEDSGTSLEDSGNPHPSMDAQVDDDAGPGSQDDAAADDAGPSGPRDASEDASEDENDAATDGEVVDPCADEPTLQQAGSLTAGSASNAHFSSDLEGVSFSLAQGTLPAGITLANDGALTGTPTVADSFAIELELSWSTCTVTRSTTLQVACPEQALSALDPFEIDSEREIALLQENAVGTSVFSVLSGAWPGGVTMSSAGHLSGKASSMGGGNVSIGAVDGAGCSVDQSYSWRVCDRLNWPVPSAWTPVDYYTGASEGSDGWINGMNVYQDREKAARFASAPAGTISNVYIKFGKADTNEPSRVVPVRIYDEASGNPGSVLGTANLTMERIMADVNADTLTEVAFASPVTVPASGVFYVAVDLTNLRWSNANKDVLAIKSTASGQTSPSAIWERQSDSNWYRYTTAGSWNLSASLYIHPRICN